MLQIIHQGHLGVEKCQLKARDCIFWPGILKDIMNMTANCATRIQFSKRQQQELLHPNNVPSFPWQRFAADLFNYQGGQYLLIPDFYSKYPIIESLPQPHTDNRPQYTHCSSQEFAAFCKQSRIDHMTSSPLYPQSNGFIDNSPVMNLLGKAEASGKDPYLALLTYHTITAEPQRLPHTITKQWIVSTF